jgi:hypothetical protein
VGACFRLRAGDNIGDNELRAAGSLASSVVAG